MDIATPCTRHIQLAPFQFSVYEPAEDTFLLLDSLQQDYQLLLAVKPSIILELGCGSGCVSAFLTCLLGSSSSIYLCTDLSPLATAASLITSSHLNPITTSLFSSLLPRCYQAIDLLIFNPPYVETESEECDRAQSEIGEGGERSWSGGKEGMQVTEKVLERLDDLLSDKGVFYLVAVKENKPDEIIERMGAKGFDGEIVMKRRAGREHLMIIRFQRSSTSSILPRPTRPT